MKLALALALSAAPLALLAPPAAAADLPASCASLWTTVKAAKPGDAVLLAPGPCAAQNFGGTATQFNFAAPGVTIKPADSKAPPVLAGLSFSNVAGINIEGLEIAWTGTPLYPLSIGNSTRVSARRLNIHGVGVAAGGLGVLIRNSTDVTLAASDVHDLGSAVSVVESGLITLDHNLAHDLARDGFLIAGSADVTVNANTLYHFTPAPGDHPDAIQFFPTANKPTVDRLIVTDNLILRDPSQAPQNQGVFGAGGRNIIIRGNTIAGAMYNAISAASTTNAEIDHNFVQGFLDMWSGITVRTSDQVSIHDNAENAVVIVPGVTNLTQANNVTVPQAATLDPAALARAQAKIGAPTPTPPSPAPDPNLAIIAGLNAQVADLQTQLADTAGRLAAEQAAHSADKAAAQAGLDAAQGRLSRLTSALQAVSTAVAAALAP